MAKIKYERGCNSRALVVVHSICFALTDDNCINIIDMACGFINTTNIAT